MSSLSGYDSEAIGFDSVSQLKRQEANVSTQTSEFSETGVGSQTTFSKDCGSSANPEDLRACDDILREYPPPGLNAFLRKVVPGMLEQLDLNEREALAPSSDEEDVVELQAKLLHELRVVEDETACGSGDHTRPSVLSLSWSSTGGSLAACAAHAQHPQWCDHEGRVRVYTMLWGALEHECDLYEDSCVTVVAYHPMVVGLLAYGTFTGELVVTSAPYSAHKGRRVAAHAGRRVAALLWTKAPASNVFLTMYIQETGKSYASDQILLSAGGDGCVCAWRVNAQQRAVERVAHYSLYARADPPPDLTCIDCIGVYPLRPSDEEVRDDLFVAGTSTGDVLVCAARAQPDVVRARPSACGACVLRVAFSTHVPGAFATVDTAGEIRLYSVDQTAPVKVFCLDQPISCAAFLAMNPCVVAAGARGPGAAAMLVDARCGRRLRVPGFGGGATVALAVTYTGSQYRIACADALGVVSVWEPPAVRLCLLPSPGDLYF